MRMCSGDYDNDKNTLNFIRSCAQCTKCFLSSVVERFLHQESERVDCENSEDVSFFDVSLTHSHFLSSPNVFIQFSQEMENWKFVASQDCALTASTYSQLDVHISTYLTCFSVSYPVWKGNFKRHFLMCSLVRFSCSFLAKKWNVEYDNLGYLTIRVNMLYQL